MPITLAIRKIPDIFRDGAWYLNKIVAQFILRSKIHSILPTPVNLPVFIETRNDGNQPSSTYQKNILTQSKDRLRMVGYLDWHLNMTSSKMPATYERRGH